MSNTTTPTDAVVTLGEYDITAEEAREDDNFRVLELPADLVEEHLTKKFTPDRYAKVCRDVAYFSDRVGSAPRKGMGKDYGDPGSGMRRSKEGALYNLAQREGLLRRAVELGFISLTNEDAFDASENEWRFTIEDRGKWLLHHFYGEHVPVRHVKRVKLSRSSTAINVNKILIDPDDTRVKSFSDWEKQVEASKSMFEDVDTGYYHVNVDVVENPDEDPRGEDLVTWIDVVNMPEQFDIDGIDGDVHLACDLEALGDRGPMYNVSGGPNYVTFERDDDGDIWIREAVDEHPVHVGEQSATGLAVTGDYEDFVPTGAKDALKNATSASWSEDYQCWYVPVEEVLVGIEAILRDSDVDTVSAYADIIYPNIEYLY